MSETNELPLISALYCTVICYALFSFTVDDLLTSLYRLSFSVTRGLIGKKKKKKLRGKYSLHKALAPICTPA